jgi:hypothetical protein
MSKRGQILELTRVRLLLFRREPELFLWVFVFPLLLAMVLGFAFRIWQTACGSSAFLRHFLPTRLYTTAGL